jgi:hypothetical protein
MEKTDKKWAHFTYQVIRTFGARHWVAESSVQSSVPGTGDSQALGTQSLPHACLTADALFDFIDGIGKIDKNDEIDCVDGGPC